MAWTNSKIFSAYVTDSLNRTNAFDIDEREDYIGTEDVFLHEGRPVMSVVTTRDDGQDVTVFAPTAHARVVET